MSGAGAGGSDRKPRLAVVVSEYNRAVTGNLLEGAFEAASRRGVGIAEDDVYRVPGAFELPILARALVDCGCYDAVVCLGAVIRGDTPHFDYVCAEAAAGIQRASMESGKPVSFGVLTTDNMEQALARAGGAVGNKGYEAVATVVETLETLARITEA